MARLPGSWKLVAADSADADAVDLAADLDPADEDVAGKTAKVKGAAAAKGVGRALATRSKALVVMCRLK
jgi:hypothetical protein